MGTRPPMYPRQLDKTIQQGIMMQQILANPVDPGVKTETPLRTGIGWVSAFSTVDPIPSNGWTHAPNASMLRRT